MPTPDVHARFSPSSAHRHLNCTASLMFESMFEGTTSVYAQEGTLAHEFCEVYGKRAFGHCTADEADAEIRALSEKPLYNPEMLTTAETYTRYLREKANTFKEPPYVAFEVRVDMTHMIPECFGTCDCIMFGDDTLHITDYKHGKGVAVSPIDNPQMRLYAIGALHLYQAIFGDAIKRVSMAIVQPRITEDVQEEVLTTEELLAWGKQAGETAKVCLGPREGQTFTPGDWCKFCRGKIACRAYGTYCYEAENVMQTPIPAKGEPSDPQARALCGLPDALTDDEISSMLLRYDALQSWYDGAKEYALEKILSGESFPGFRVVEGKSNRAWSDQDAAIKAILDAGYDAAVVYKPPEAESLSKLEKVIGKKEFASICGQYITKPNGKPTLVVESDKRPNYSPGLADFAGVKQE